MDWTIYTPLAVFEIMCEWLTDDEEAIQVLENIKPYCG